MRPINKVIIQKIEEVDSISALVEQHIDKGMSMVGFHLMIEQNGDSEIGRNITTIGNHFIGENATSIGIATIGKELSKEQKITISEYLIELELKAPNITDVYIVENGELKKYK